MGEEVEGELCQVSRRRRRARRAPRRAQSPIRSSRKGKTVRANRMDGKRGVTDAEDDGVRQVDVLEIALPGRVAVLELLHREGEVGDDEEEHCYVEGHRVPDSLKVGLEPQEASLAPDVQAPLVGQLVEHSYNLPVLGFLRVAFFRLLPELPVVEGARDPFPRLLPI